MKIWIPPWLVFTLKWSSEPLVSYEMDPQGDKPAVLSKPAARLTLDSPLHLPSVHRQSLQMPNATV